MWQFANFARGPQTGLKRFVLTSLQQSPKNGVELMDDIEKQSYGFWRPSPGSIYPLLDTLSRDGMVVKQTDGKYHLTEKGSKEEEGQFWPRMGGPTTVDQMVAEMGTYVSYFEDLGREKISAFATELDGIRDRIAKLLEK